MNIETKFNLDEHAWFMKNNKPIEVIISCIEVFEVGTNQSRITYNAKNIINSVSWLDHTKLNEDILFKSKNDLMRSLFGTDSKCKGEVCTAVNGVGHSTECIKEHEQCYEEVRV